MNYIKTIFIIVFTFCGSCGVNLYAQQDTLVSQKILSVLLAADAAKNTDKIWLNYTPLVQPVLVYFPAEKRSLLIGHPNPGESFKPYAGGSFSVPVYTGGARTLNSSFSFDYKINGLPVTAFRYTPDQKPDQFLAKVIHEAFHVYQRKRFRLPEAVDLMETAVSRQWLAGVLSEQKTLADAFHSESDWLGYGKLFIDTRTARRAAHPAALTNWEIFSEMHEGTAFYAEAKFRAAFLNDPSLKREMDARLGVLDDASGSLYTVLEVKNYASGAVMCVLLDRLGAAWKKQAESGEDLFALLRTNFPSGIKPAASHDYGALADNWLTITRKEAQGNLARLAQSPKLHFKITLPEVCMGGFSGTFLPISEGYDFYDVTEYSMEGKSLNLLLKNAIFTEKDSASPLGCELDIAADSRITIVLDSKPAALPYTGKFKTIKLIGGDGEIRLSSDTSGVLSADMKTVSIGFAQ